MKRLFAVLLILLTLFPLDAQLHPEYLNFQQFSTPQGLPNGKVHRVLKDSNGFIWIATYYGLFRYDGYEVTQLKSSYNSPNQLLHNDVLSICEDDHNRIWIGTQSGLNVLDNISGRIKNYQLPDVNRQRVHEILQSSDGSIYLGYIRGMYIYNEEGDSLQALAGNGFVGDVPAVANIQDIIEDKDGDILISTWTQGLYRYEPKEKRFTHYDVKSEQGSTIRMQDMLIDDRGRLWLGTYGSGLYSISFTEDKKDITYQHYYKEDNNSTHFASNHIIALSKNSVDHSIWLGTFSGLSIMEFDNDGEPVFTNHTEGNQPNIPQSNINDIICDSNGMMWLATDDEGLFFVDPYSSKFNVFRFDVYAQSQTNNIKSLFVDSDNAIWATSGYGATYHNGGVTHQIISGYVPQGIYYSEKKDLVLIPIRDGGISSFRNGKEIGRYLTQNCGFLPTNNVRCVHEDADGNWWVGTFLGLGVNYADGRTFKYSSSLNVSTDLGNEIVEITNDHKGSLWLSTADHGIVRISGDLNDPTQWNCQSYNVANSKLPGNTAIFVNCDKDGNIWAGLEGYGLCLYDEGSDTFHSMHQQYNLPGDMVNTMMQDVNGDFWLGTNQGLACLSLNGTELKRMRIFTESDGLPDNFFNSKSACYTEGMMYFGCNQGLVYFRPSESALSERDVNCIITDILINGVSLREFPQEERLKICDFSPTFSKAITLPSKYNNFELSFASLTYSLPLQNRYSYRLKGFDDEWRNSPATHRRAYYSNLNPGTYTFEYKGTNENGDWSETKRIKVTILPPWWLSWWAYILYTLAAIAIIWVIFLQVKHRISLRNALKVKQMENEKVEELNHIKLQFFANITHELMTPLTIISASLDELKNDVRSELVGTMGVNVQRLMRLLQQILEFRKAETGNLKLRVAKGDLALFVRHEVESFIPLIRKRQQHMSAASQEDVMIGYFDTDKLDKILYNLLSNAAKYTQAGGAILVDVNYTEDRKGIKLVVKDTGRGMSQEQLKTLFTRFYDGDYRQSHTIGTGIGLSLVRDLVDLHHGKINVESAVGVGSTFTIEIPIVEDAYDKEEIIVVEPVQPTEAIQQITDLSNQEESDGIALDEEENIPTILLVEDNEELQTVMARLLKRQYRVIQAFNGKEAFDIMHKEEIDLVVSDVIMPEMDGIELTQSAKADFDVCHIPIILLTAKRSEEDRDAGYNAGADAYLTKPFSLSALHARIHNLLRRRERAAEDFKHQVAIDTTSLNYTDIDQEFLKRAIEIVNNHLSDSSFDVVQFAAEMAASRSTLYKKLRSLTNLNPTGFVRNIRLKAACKVMEENPNVRINELAYSIGFNDPKYFSICFKKEFGMQPSEYCNCFRT